MDCGKWIERYSVDCRLKYGLSGVMVRDEYGIMDLRARIYTLKKSGINVLHNSIKGAKGMREYFLSPDEISRVKEAGK